MLGEKGGGGVLKVGNKGGRREGGGGGREGGLHGDGWVWCLEWCFVLCCVVLTGREGVGIFSGMYMALGTV